ncbi:hypothetical protein [Streptomyces eurythermus]
MRDIALIMFAALGALLLIVSFPLRGSWRFVWRMAVLGTAVICAELTIIRLAPDVGGWVVEVVK